MFQSPFDRFGWADAVGPLRFLRPRWSVGPRWRRCWARFFAGRSGVACQSHTKGAEYAVSGFFVPADLWNDLTYMQKEDYVMGWIRDLRSGSGPGGTCRDALDREWLSAYPALHEYLVEGERPDGTPRRTSTLTIFADAGAWKVFLNERDAGASLCSTGGSIGEALGALEVMLEAENTPWRFSDPPRQGNGQEKRRKS